MVVNHLQYLNDADLPKIERTVGERRDGIIGGREDEPKATREINRELSPAIVLERMAAPWRVEQLLKVGSLVEQR
ncbi:MAG: hypothetical protein ABFE08_04755 [Armatimonadia bacterium]